VLAVLPFSILNTLVFSYTLYGMAGLNMSGEAIAKNGVISVLLYLIASQVSISLVVCRFHHTSGEHQPRPA
jgi:hypothetical protein